MGSDLTSIDLTVGDEKYKYDLGGSTHEIYNLNCAV
jgi:CelD/BcsL family acetyltransferase involved in cellulose biosynthesis